MGVVVVVEVMATTSTLLCTGEGVCESREEAVMLRVKEIKDLDGLRNLPASPPYELLERAAAWEERGEPWWVLEVREEHWEEPHWLLASFDMDGQAFLFLQEETLTGQWDADRRTFIDEEGCLVDLRGHRTTATAIEEEEAEEDAGWEDARGLNAGLRCSNSDLNQDWTQL